MFPVFICASPFYKNSQNGNSEDPFILSCIPKNILWLSRCIYMNGLASGYMCYGLWLEDFPTAGLWSTAASINTVQSFT